MDDPDIEAAAAAGVRRGEFATIEDARADFLRTLDESMAQADRGESADLRLVWADLRERFAHLPRAAE